MCVNVRESRAFRRYFEWWPQRDSNPCFSLERAVSWASRRWGRPTAPRAPPRVVIAASAPTTYTKFVGWGRRIRTPATWSRATRPTTRRSPTNAPNLTIPNSANRGLEGAARAEARHLDGRNLNLLAGARVAAVARGAARDHECSESGDSD